MELAVCSEADLDDWARMRAALWPGGPEAELRQGAAAMLAAQAREALNLIARIDGAAAGFAEATLRHDHVNGCETSPVVFLEGLYVMPGHRRHGVAEALVARIGEWGKTMGCTELASDALADNLNSHAFHRAAGFEETERVVYFRKRI